MLMLHTKVAPALGASSLKLKAQNQLEVGKPILSATILTVYDNHESQDFQLCYQEVLSCKITSMGIKAFAVKFPGLPLPQVSFNGEELIYVS